MIKLNGFAKATKVIVAHTFGLSKIGSKAKYGYALNVLLNKHINIIKDLVFT